uniref:Uncharacterized protein n=1 Tax=Knipowitschia caucasica TaxID=637954 RepID=A0AAV2J1D9_KNICA
MPSCRRPRDRKSRTYVDECLSADSCGEHASCENLIGGFHCRCDKGYRTDQQGACVGPSSGFSPSSSGSSPSSSSPSHSLSGSSFSSSDSSPSTSGSSHSSFGSSQSTSGSSPSASGSSHSTSGSLPSSSGSSRSPSGSSHSSSSASPSSSGSSHPTSGASQSSSGSSPSSSGSSYPNSGTSQSSSGSSSSDSFPSSFGSSTSITGSSTSIAGSSLSPAGSFLPLSPSVTPLSPSLPGELRECYYDLDSGECSVLSQNCSLQECCCTEGRGWGQGCVYNICPRPQTEEFQRLCPNGRGYVTTGPGAFDYTDVDECKLFGSDVCKSGVCVNNIPGFSCYCPSGYVFNLSRLQCEDHDECEEESCSGGLCVNTQGSFYCSCPHPLVLDDTHRTCVNASQQGLDDNVSLCWQQVNADLLCQSLLLGSQLSFTDCCCLYGEGWGLECALCPLQDTEDYARLCSSVHSPLYPETRPGTRPGSGPARGSPQEPYFPPFALEPFPPALDYDDSPPVGGREDRYDRGYGSLYGGFFPEPNYDPNIPYSPDQSRFSLDQSRFNPDQSRFSPDQSRYTPDHPRFSPDGSRFGPDQSRFSPDSAPFLVPPDPRSEEAFEVPSSLSSDQFYTGTRDQVYTGTRDQAYTGTRDQVYTGTGDQDEWRGLPPFNRPEPRRVYDRRSEAVEEDCGIVDGCLNGRCIRIAEGYTCDCYHGYELDLTHMTCRDVDECDGSVRPEFPCINARCVNTDGSYRCVCRRGYVLSHRPNYCVSA